MLLAIDIGNTNIVIGTFNRKQLIKSWRISTDQSKLADEYGILIRNLLQLSDIDYAMFKGIIISCVVPSIHSAMLEMGDRYFHISPVVLSPEMDLGIPLLYDNPNEIGPDRIANTLGVYMEYGGPAIVVDFGTATTFDAVSEKGAYLGGVIAPGIGISANALFERAARLKRVELRRPGRVIGKNTDTCVQSGFYYGFLGQMEEIIRQMKIEIGGAPKVIATGGLSKLFAADSQLVDKIDLDLTLKGLQIIYERIQLKK
jgi:type III pantothenate kinase